jgi:predicted nucleotidyltransferase
MDPVAAPTFLKTPIGRLVRALAPTRIVLFGSYAKGTERPGSDIDLLVIASAAGQPATALRRARQLVATNFPPIDIVLCTPEDVEHADRAASPFLRSILESGVTVFSRPEPSPSFDAQDAVLRCRC